MQLKIEPTSELSLKLGGKRIGRLEGLYIDVSSSASILLSVPKVKLAISIEEAAFGGDTKTLNTLIEKVSKFKFLDVTLKR